MKDSEILSLLAKYKKEDVYEILYKEAVNDFFFNKFSYSDKDTDFFGYISKREKVKKDSYSTFNWYTSKGNNVEKFQVDGFPDIQVNREELRHTHTGLICKLNRIDCESAYSVLLDYKSKHAALIKEINKTLDRCMKEVGKFKKLDGLNHQVFKALADRLVPMNCKHKWTHFEKSSLLEYQTIDPATGYLVTKTLMFNHEPYFRDL